MIKDRPLRAALVFALTAGLFLIPLTSALDLFMTRKEAFIMVLYFYLTAYSYFLTRISGTGSGRIVLPLAILAPAAVLGQSFEVFILQALGLLSWVRSGLCFKRPIVRTIILETVLTAGGLALTALAAPQSRPALALAVWLFFLVQALYFIFPDRERRPEAGLQADPFEQARNRARQILSAGSG